MDIYNFWWALASLFYFVIYIAFCFVFVVVALSFKSTLTNPTLFGQL
jgi:hypothetical protein